MEMDGIFRKNEVLILCEFLFSENAHHDMVIAFVPQLKGQWFEPLQYRVYTSLVIVLVLLRASVLSNCGFISMNTSQTLK